MNIKKYLTIVVLLAVTYASNLNATVYRVDPGASGGGTGLSWTDAMTNMTEAFSTAGDGHELWVKAGVYVGNFTIGLGTKLYGGFDGTEGSRNDRDFEVNKTIFHGNGGAGIICQEGTGYQTIDGIMLTGCGGSDAGGIRVRKASGVQIRNCVFTNNIGSAAVLVTRSGPDRIVIQSCKFSNNTARAISFSGKQDAVGTPPFNLTVDKCEFRNNSTADAGGGGAIHAEYVDDGFELYNSAFIYNSAPIGGALLTDPRTTNAYPIWNCTFYSNSAATDGHSYYMDSRHSTATLGNADMRNCIVWGQDTSLIHVAGLNTREAALGLVGQVSTLTIGNTCLQNALASVSWTVAGGVRIRPLAGVIQNDPLFTDALAGDIHLTGNSPCIDTGTDVGAPTETAEDIDSIERPRGDAYDMGAWEYVDPVPKGAVIMLYAGKLF